MKAVWKFPFEVKDEFTLQIPEGFKVLHVGAKGNTPTLWCLVDPKAEKVPVDFSVRGTGYYVEDSLTFVGTFALSGEFALAGGFVGHLFTRGADPFGHREPY